MVQRRMSCCSYVAGTCGRGGAARAPKQGIGCIVLVGPSMPAVVVRERSMARRDARGSETQQTLPHTQGVV